MGKKSREKWQRRLEKAGAPGVGTQGAATAPIVVTKPATVAVPAKKNTAELIIQARYPNSDGLIQLGPLVEARWSVPASHAAALTAAGRAVPPRLEGAMLIDTGATSTAIDLGFAQQLGLKSVGIAQMYGAHGLQGSPMFEAHIQILAGRGGVKVWIDSDLQVAGIKDLQAFGKSNGLTKGGVIVPVIGLLGRDFLSYGVMNYDGTKGLVEIRVGPGLKTVPATPPPAVPAGSPLAKA